MESAEADIIEELKKTSNYDGFVDLVVASQIIGSNELYQDGIQRLIASKSLPTLEQAMRMGVEATYNVIMSVKGGS